MLERLGFVAVVVVAGLTWAGRPPPTHGTPPPPPNALPGPTPGPRPPPPPEPGLHLLAPAGAGLETLEVSVANYSRCVMAGACSTDNVTRSEWGPASACNHGHPDRLQHPMNCVDVAQAEAYCRWEGKHLPTDAEMVQALAGRPYPWGEAAPEAARVCRGSMDDRGTCPVGSLPGGANGSGVLDLAGNVAEWTSTPACPGCAAYVVRGGAWSGGWGDTMPEHFGRLGDRLEGGRRGSYLGFRCASGPTTAAVRTRPAPAPATVDIDAYVVTRADGSGNDQWSQGFLQRVLVKAESMSHGELRFRTLSYSRPANAALYDAGPQQPLLDWAGKQGQVGRLTLVVSNPHSQGTAGLALENSFDKDFKPRLVIRSRKNDASERDVYECAAIFLHELGHTVGYSHDGTTAAMPWPCDAWWDYPPARDRVTQLARWGELHARGAGPQARAPFTCKVGAPVPDTNQLFDPPTAAPTAHECAQRCLDWPGCVAHAQPTWDNARCFLFSQGAVAQTNKGWNNVDVCWRK